MANEIGKINLDFQVPDSGNPKMLFVWDFSKWRVIENMPSYIEITLPGARNPVIRNFDKNKMNGYNSLSLGVSCHVDCEENLQDLQDGVYEICVKGGKDGTYTKHKYFLKTDKFQLELDKVWVRLGLDYKLSDEKTILAIFKIKALLEAAKAATKVGKIPQANEYFITANELLEKYKECKNCI